MFSLFKTPQRMEDLALFSRHMAGAMSARVPLPEILRAYELDAEGGPLDKAVGRVAERVEGGATLSEAMDGEAGVFPSAYRRLVRLGEQGHTLPGLMRETAERMEEGLKVYEQYRRSAAYPLVILSLLFVIISFLAWKILPTFMGIFETLGAELPTVAGVNATNFLVLVNLAVLVPIVYLLGVVMGLKLWGFGQGRVALSVPLIGPVMRTAETANFANYLGLLLEQRVPLAEALGLLTDASENTYVRAAIEDFHRRYESGESLGELMQSQPLFPPSMAVMIAAAEDQGELAGTLRHLGTFYRDRTLHGLAVVREFMEPLMLVVIGILISLIMASFYTPLFSIARLVR